MNNLRKVIYMYSKLYMFHFKFQMVSLAVMSFTALFVAMGLFVYMFMAVMDASIGPDYYYHVRIYFY